MSECDLQKAKLPGIDFRVATHFLKKFQEQFKNNLRTKL